jgi:hypothetical protein
MAKSETHVREFEARFRRHVVEWKSQSAITREKEAVAELNIPALTWAWMWRSAANSCSIR